MSETAERIRERRQELGLTQAEVARSAGTSQPAISRYERGGSVPSPRTLKRILEACATKRPRPSDVLIAHRDEVLAILRRYGASRVLVFGSVVRGEDDADSDVDLAVDHLDEDTYSWGQPKAKWDLEDLLGVPVDVLEVRHMRPRVRVEALREARPL